MPCLLTLLALVVPRFVIVMVWLFSNWLEAAYTTLLWPILGFIFLPTTLLWYAVVVNVYGGEWSIIPIAGTVVALMIDLSPASGKKG
ncbi:MAG: hypothetical protein WD021_06760 [Rhodothermales bacterium]